MKYLIAVVFLAGLHQKACNDPKTGPAQNDNCADVMCTMDYRGITVASTYGKGRMVSVDSTITRRNNDGAIIHRSGAGDIISLLDDSAMKDLKNTSGDYTLEIYKGGRLFAEEPYVLGADCCHVQKFSGKDTLILPIIR